MAVLAPAVASRLSKLVPRLASDHEGEIVATARAIQRVLSANGASLHELASFLDTGPGERIVYRDRIIYRDPPVTAAPKPKKPRKPKKPQAARTEAPAHEEEPDPNKDYTISFEEIMAVGDLVLSSGGLSEREEDFVSSMLNQARRRRERFHMTIKQANWWRVIVDETGVADFVPRSA